MGLRQFDPPNQYLETKGGFNLLHVAHYHAGAQQGLVCAVRVPGLREQHQVPAALGQLAQGCLFAAQLCGDGCLLQSAVMPVARAVATLHIAKIVEHQNLEQGSFCCQPAA